MSTWLPAVVFVLSVAGMAVVRGPHIRRSVRVSVVTSRRSRLDNGLVAMVSLGFVLPLVWLATPILAFADRPLSLGVLGSGVMCHFFGLCFLHRSHVDLGTNWSNTLELRDQHSLVTGGVYERVRHPMYLALLLHGVGQALVLPNWVAGLSFVVPFTALVALRVGPEERMMVEAFGGAYERYRARTKRLLPYVW